MSWVYVIVSYVLKAQQLQAKHILGLSWDTQPKTKTLTTKNLKTFVKELVSSFRV